MSKWNLLRAIICTYTSIHEMIFGYLYIKINEFLKNKPAKMLGSRVAVKLPNGKRPEPDLLYVEDTQYNKDDIVLQTVPKWIIEIISSSTREHDYGEKLKWYQEAGVEEIGLADPETKFLTLYKLIEDQYVISEISSGVISPLDHFDLKIDVKTMWI
ncbi:MAG: Uma2 family endonuclease [Candidatus Heimdallarchaeota archaeon]|nr:Uma2 family endonuclease [Candidatus Heimdallarchaeota archaeon]